MYNTEKTFSLADIIESDEEDMDFAVAELWCFADGNNSHNLPISNEVLVRDAHTILGKFVVAKYDQWKKDVTTHVPDEQIIGYIDPRQEIRFEKKIVDGEEKTFLVVNALMSKIYCSQVIELFQKDNHRAVSCEFSCALQYEEDSYGRPIDEFGRVLKCPNPILGYSMHGVTILGKDVLPSISGADMDIKKFAMSLEKDVFKRLASKYSERR